ncbi:MAG: hypothetical protein F6K22_09135 [Okeania sp. SIO2F4]|uniref:hypothetical protein n=1 Tax=Okeania sp. SIO2F4 TaxID=2607790 RepID=UPI00142C3AB3|nr:hypothetical protein [Okeania sp. SIO2F4]NES02997.1 hypothetical protein [Okeania sp. SIO2F4]
MTIYSTNNFNEKEKVSGRRNREAIAQILRNNYFMKHSKEKVRAENLHFVELQKKIGAEKIYLLHRKKIHGKIIALGFVSTYT